MERVLLDVSPRWRNTPVQSPEHAPSTSMDASLGGTGAHPSSQSQGGSNWRHPWPLGTPGASTGIRGPRRQPS